MGDFGDEEVGDWETSDMRIRILGDIGYAEVGDVGTSEMRNSEIDRLQR